MSVSCGVQHYALVTASGSLFTWGDGNFCLGNGKDRNCYEEPQLVTFMPKKAVQVSAGFNHTGIVTEEGDLFMCGYGYFGQLGLGQTDSKNVPTQIPREFFENVPVLMVSCGTDFTTALTRDGDVFTFGDGRRAELGHENFGDSSKILAPYKLGRTLFGNEKITFISSSAGHTMAISESGLVWVWGEVRIANRYYTSVAPEKVDPKWFDNEAVVYVCAGNQQRAVVTKTGRLFMLGKNENGQLGVGHARDVSGVFERVKGQLERHKVKMVSFGSHHALVLDEQGCVWESGAADRVHFINDESLRYIKESREKHRFERVTKCKDEDGVVVTAFGGNSVASICAGTRLSFAVTENGSLFTWAGFEYDYTVVNKKKFMEAFAGATHPRLGEESSASQAGDAMEIIGQNLRDGIVYHTDNTSAKMKRIVLPGDERVGRFSGISQETMLAFTMATDDRLGKQSPAHALAIEDVMRLVTAELPIRDSLYVDKSTPELQPLITLLGGRNQERENSVSRSNSGIAQGSGRFCVRCLA